MKSMAELEAIRKKTLARINLRREDASKLVRVVVGMGTCGIAAGARALALSSCARGDCLTLPRTSCPAHARQCEG